MNGLPDPETLEEYVHRCPADLVTNIRRTDDDSAAPVFRMETTTGRAVVRARPQGPCIEIEVFAPLPDMDETATALPLDVRQICASLPGYTDFLYGADPQAVDDETTLVLRHEIHAPAVTPDRLINDCTRLIDGGGLAGGGHH